jgi:type II secretion system protein D
MIEQLYKEQSKSLPPPSGGVASILPEAKGNRLIVSGPEQEIAKVEAILREFDPAVPKNVKTETRVVRLKNSNAQDLSGLVEKSLNTEGETIRLLVDARSNSLVITGETSAVEAAILIIDQLDGDRAGKPRQIRIIELKQGDAKTLAPMLTDLFAEMLRDQRGSNYVTQARIVADANGNRIIATGPADELEQIAGLAEKLDTGSKQGEGTRVFQLKTAKASDVAKMITSAMISYENGNRPVQKVTASADDRTNTLIASGSKSDLADVALIVQRLESNGSGVPADASREVRTIEVKIEDAAKLVALASQVWTNQNSLSPGASEVSLTVDSTGKRVVAVAPKTLMAQVEALIKALDDPSESGGRNLQFLELKKDSAPQVLPMLTKLYLEQERNSKQKPATLLPDPAGTRLALIGADGQVASIKKILEQLESEYASAPRDTKFFELGTQENLQRTLPVLRQLYQDYVQNTPAAGAADAQFIPEEKTARLIVTARKPQLERIDQLIAQLAPAKTNAARATQVFIVGQTDEVQRLLPLINQLYKEQTKSDDATKPADAQIIGDERGGRIIVTGRDDQIQLIQTIIGQLREGKFENKHRETKVYDLKQATATDLAATVRAIYTEASKNNPSALSNPALILPDTLANRLIVSGTETEVAEIEKIISKLDQISAQSGGTRIFKLKALDATQVAPMLSTALVIFDRYGRTIPRVSVGADAKSNSLIVSGEAKDLQSAAVIIEQLDSAAERQPRQMRVFQIKTGRSSDLATKVRQLYQDQARGAGESGAADALIMGDIAADRLIVAASEQHMAMISKIVEQLDEAAQAAARQIRVVTLKNTKASNVIPIVSQMFSQILGATDPTQRLVITPAADDRTILLDSTTPILERVQEVIDALENGITPEARELRFFSVGSSDELERIVPLLQQIYRNQLRGKSPGETPDGMIYPDPITGRIIASGKKEHLDLMEEIFKSLKSANDTEPRVTKVFDLKSATAADLVATVKSVYSETMKTSPKDAANPALILADAMANRVIVTGATNQLASIEEIIGKLDQISAQSGGTRIFKLKNLEATQIAPIVSSALVEVNRFGRSVPRVSIGADPKSNSLIISGEAKDLQSASVIIEQLDSKAEKTVRQMRVFSLPPGSANDVAQKVRQLYQDQVKSEGEVGMPDAIFIPDNSSGRLIVAASENQLPLIEKIVDQLDQAAQDGARQVMVLNIQKNSAATTAHMISQLFTNQVSTTDLTQKLIVTPTPDDRKLVLDGPKPLLARVNELVQTLDKAETTDKAIIQTVRLRKAQAESVAEAVTKTLAARTSGPASTRATVTPVVDSNSLLIDGPPEVVQEILKLIHELDEESTGGDIEIRIYKLENGKAREVSAILNQMMPGIRRQAGRFGRYRGGGGGGGGFGGLNIVVDERSNSLVVSANADQFKILEQLVLTLDKRPEATDRNVHFAFLKNAKAYDVANRIEELYSERSRNDRPIVTTDTFSNSLTIIASKSDLKEIEEIISTMDASALDNSFQVRMLVVQRVPADQMARMLQDIYPQMTEGQITIVEKLKPLPADQKPDTNAIPEVFIAVDKRSNSLLLSGPSRELDRINGLVTDLTFYGYNSDSEFKMYHLKEADPVAVAKTLADLFKSDPVPNPQPRQGEGNTVTPPPKMTVVPETRTHSLLVRGRPTDFNLVEKLIEQLDISGLSAQFNYRLIPLANTTPAKVLPLVTQMITQMGLARPGDPLTISAYPRINGLFAVGREALLNQLESVAKALDTTNTYQEEQVLVVTLKNSIPAQFAAVLQNMLKPSVAGDLTPETRELQEQVRQLKVPNEKGEPIVLDLSKPIKIVPDPAGIGGKGGNRLILASTPENLKAMGALIELLDTVPVTEGVVVKIFPVKNADAIVLAETITSVFTQGAKLGIGPAGQAQPDGAAGKALTSPLNVASDRRSNTLVVSGNKEAMALAERLIKDLDKESESFITEVKLFRLKNASVAKLSPLLQSVFMESAAAVPGTEGLSTQVSRLQTALGQEDPKTTDRPKARAALTIQGDEASNIMVVSARKDLMPLIEDVIKNMDIPAASGLDTVRIFPLQHSDALKMQTIINSLYLGAKAAQNRSEDRPSVAIDPRTNVLIVSGNEKAFALITGLLAQLDTELALDASELRVIDLENADATSLAPLLQRAFEARAEQRAALGGQRPELSRAVILPDPRSNRLIVGASNESFDLLQSLVKELDQSGVSLAGKIRLIPLKNANAGTMATTLTTLFRSRSFRGGGDGGSANRTRPIILPDPRMNALLVSAGIEDNKALDELLVKLDLPITDPAVQLSLIPLKHNDATAVAAMLERTFTARMQNLTQPGSPAQPQDRVNVEAEAFNNALIVTANKENLELIKGLVEKIDVEPESREGLVQLFPLKSIDAARAASLLRSLVQQGVYRPGASAGGGRRGREAMAVTVDQRSNTLIVSASPENLSIVRDVLRQIDSGAFADSGAIQLFQLKYARASQLASTLEQFFRSKRVGESNSGEGERSVPVTITADDRTNTLIVTGGRESFETIQRMITQLDIPEVFDKTHFVVINLKHATALKIQSTLQRLFLNRPSRVSGRPPEPINVVADSWSNALIIAAAAEDLPMVQSLVETLDTQTDPAMQVMVLPLAKADARSVAQTVQSLYRDNAQGTASPVSVNVDERLNAVVISAGEADARRISELVAKLDSDMVARVAEIRIFPLKHAQADELASILTQAINSKPIPQGTESPNRQSLLQFITRGKGGEELVASALKETVMVTADRRSNALVVSAPVDSMHLLEQIITSLDSSTPQMARIKVIALSNADARQMADILITMFRLQPTLIPAGQQASFEYSLDRSGPQTSGTFAAEPGPGAEAQADVEGAAIGSVQQKSLVVTVDLRTNSLLIGGTDHYVNLATEIATTLDSSPATERKTEVYRLKNAQATSVETALRSFLDLDKTKMTQTVGDQALGAAQRLLEREISIVAETNSNTLLLSASPRYFSEYTTLIKELDQPQPQVLIQVLLAEVTLDETTDLGVEWSINGHAGNNALNTGTALGVMKDLTTFGGYSAAITGNDFTFLLRALQADGRLEVLSRPQILTADNQKATINIGQRIPLINDTRVTDQGNTLSTYRYEDIGVILNVTPRISSEGGFVKMDVEPSISDLSSSNIQVGTGVNQPIINQRRATTTVSVKDGQSIIIGGLISSSDDTRTKRVPWLGDIPVLGALFRSSKTVKTRKELLIVLTPQLLLQPEDAGSFTTKQLEHSRIQDQLQRDPLQRQMLEPLFPPNTFEKKLPRQNPVDGLDINPDKL